MDFAAVRETTILFDIATGVLFALLGIFVLTLRPRRSLNIALVTYCLALGLSSAAGNARTAGFLGGETTILDYVFSPAIITGLVLLALRFPTPITRAERRILVAPALIGGAAFLLGGDLIDLVGGSGRTPDAVARGLLGDLTRAANYFFLATLVARYTDAAAAGRHDDDRPLVTVSIALLLTVAGRAGWHASRLPDIAGPGALGTYAGYMDIAGAIVFCGMWLRAAAAARPEAARTPRNIALLVPATALAMMVFSHATDPALAGDLGPLGLLRGIGVAVLAYAILQHQILGIDVKVRWTLSKSTIAAVFIAVFFIASEAAQQFFGETLESTYLGIAAAGMLVFAMAPLQRAAERLAERAVPIGAPPSAMAGTSNDDLYRRALRIALVDRELTRDEELTLADLSERLNVGRRRALELRHEVERERDAAEAGGARP